MGVVLISWRNQPRRHILKSHGFGFAFGTGYRPTLLPSPHRFIYSALRYHPASTPLAITGATAVAEEGYAGFGGRSLGKPARAVASALPSPLP